MPLKVTKDTRGYIYVANSSDSNGILMLDGDGAFRQYFGANKVSLTFWESVARLLWDREDRLGTVVTLPYSFNNIYASSDGYIYATTTTTTPPQVRSMPAVRMSFMQDTISETVISPVPTARQRLRTSATYPLTTSTTC